MKKNLILAQIIFGALLVGLTSAQTPKPIDEYNGKTPPGSLGTKFADSVYLYPFPASASTNNGGAIIICPGGAYAFETMGNEGYDPARYFNQKGFSTFVLKYRLGTNGYHHPVEMEDGQRAIRWVRQNSKRYGIIPNRVGIMGFSAGGHLASTVGTHFDSGNPASADSVERQSCRPDFLMLLYPVITMDASFTHAGSRTNLLGSNPSQALVDLLSNEKQVTAQTPPAFLAAGLNDGTVPFKNSRVFYDSCLKFGVPTKLDSFSNAPHGFGLANGQDGAPNLPLVAVWPTDALAFLAAHVFPVTAVEMEIPKNRNAVLSQNRFQSWKVFVSGIWRDLQGRK